jgi:hypothetical protein
LADTYGNVGCGKYSAAKSFCLEKPWVPRRYWQFRTGPDHKEDVVGIGVSVFLLAVGGILAFGVSDRLSGVDLTVVGYVLMGAGAIGIVVALALANQRSRTVRTVERRDPYDPLD